MKGEVLFRGKVDWTVNEDTMEVLDIGNLANGSEDVLICIRNGSPTVDLVCNVGHMAPCYPALTTPRGEVDVTDTADEYADEPDTFTAPAHGLHVGDAIVFSGTGGGVTAGLTYYVTAVSDANTFQVSTARGGSAVNLVNDETNTFHIADEFFALTTIDVPKFAAGTSTAPVAGLVAFIVQGWNGGRLAFEKSAATAAAFSAYVEVRRL